jgi:hypothetical protein
MNLGMAMDDPDRPATQCSQFSINILVGGIPTPLKNMKVSWDYDIPNIWKKKCSKPPTSIEFHTWGTYHQKREIQQAAASSNMSGNPEATKFGGKQQG